MPVPAGTGLPEGKRAAFLAGAQAEVGGPGWRRAWIVRDAGGAVAGHVDLRAHPEELSSHRCLLGLGVHRDHRRRGLARRLLAHAEAWAAAQPGLAWIDLQVLSSNEPAVALYRAAGWQMTGGVPDRYRIDGRPVGEVAFVRRLAGG